MVDFGESLWVLSATNRLLAAPIIRDKLSTFSPATVLTERWIRMGGTAPLGAGVPAAPTIRTSSAGNAQRGGVRRGYLRGDYRAVRARESV